MCVSKKLNVFAFGRSAISFGNIACDGDGSPSQLVGQTKSLGRWKARCEFVDRQGKLDCPLPNYEVFERTSQALVFGSQAAHHLLLPTPIPYFCAVNIGLGAGGFTCALRKSIRSFTSCSVPTIGGMNFL